MCVRVCRSTPALAGSQSAHLPMSAALAGAGSFSAGVLIEEVGGKISHFSTHQDTWLPRLDVPRVRMYPDRPKEGNNTLTTTTTTTTTDHRQRGRLSTMAARDGYGILVTHGATQRLVDKAT